MPDFIVEQMSANQIRMVFPVLRATIPSLTLRGWLKYASPAITRPKRSKLGVLVVRRRNQPYLCGCACYRVYQDPQLRSVLLAEHLVALDLLHPDDVLAALANELLQTAASLGCHLVKSMVDASRPTLRRGLEHHGHALDGFVLITNVADSGD